MANIFAPNGSSYITAPTLGNLLSSTVRVVSKNVTWASGAGYIWSQAANSSREWGLAQSGGDVQFIAGGTNNVLGAFATLFPSGISDAELEIEVNMSTGAWTLSMNGSPVSSGTLSVGVARIDGCLFRVGGRGSTNTSGDTATTFLLGTTDKVGDTQVYINGALTRDYVMPTGTATTIPDNQNNQDATLHGGTGDGTDWEVAPGGSITAPIISYPIYAIDTDGLSKYVFSGTYSGLTPTAVQYRVMQGAGEIQTWTNVGSFSGGVYSFDPAITWGVGYTLEVRATDNGTDYVTDTSTSFDVGPLIGCIGDSSSENAFTDSSAITSGRVHVESGGGWTTTDAALMTGESAVALANYLHANFGNNCPVGFYDAGVGGTLLTVGWQPGGANYNTFLAMVDEENISAIVISAGYNDASADAFTSAANAQAALETTYAGLRTEFGASLPVVHLQTQRDDRTTQQDQQYVWDWQGEIAVRDAHADTYWVVRQDLDISGDTIHLTQAAANASFERAGICLDFIFDNAAYYRGPQITSATISGTTVTVNLGGNDTNFSAISPISAIEGFRVLDDGTPMSLSSVTSSGTTITIELSTAPTGTVTLEFAGYDANPWTDADADNYPHGDDALALPVEPIFTAMSVQVDNVDVAPEVQSITVRGGGRQVALGLSEDCIFGAGGSSGFTLSLSNGPVSLTYLSQAGTNSILFLANRVVVQGETGTGAYVQPGDGIQDLAGNDLPSFSDFAVTNNSTQTVSLISIGGDNIVSPGEVATLVTAGIDLADIKYIVMVDDQDNEYEIRFTGTDQVKIPSFVPLGQYYVSARTLIL